MSAPDDNARPRRALAWAGLAIAEVFAVVQACMPNGILPIDMAAWFANGLAVAVYAPLIRAAGPRRGALWSSLALGFVGLTHAFWVVFGSAPISDFLRMIGFPPTVLNIAPMFVLTGVVFTVLVVAAAPRPSTVVVMTIATGLSITASATPDLWHRSMPLAPPHMVGFPALFLHVGIAAALFLSALRDWQRLPSWCCAACGYDLRGVPIDRCPECGRANPLITPKPSRKREF